MDDVVHARAPYRRDPGQDVTNATDAFHAEDAELALRRDGEAVVGLITLDVRRA